MSKLDKVVFVEFGIVSHHSRTLDLDILFFEQEIIENELLSVPHPRLENRLFVLRPLAKK